MRKTILLLLSLSLISCSSNTEEAIVPVTPIEPDMFIKGKISNENPFEINYFTNTTTSYFETVSTTTYEGNGDYTYSYSSGLKPYLNENKNSINIEFRRLHFGTHATETTTFKNNFSTNIFDYLDTIDYQGNIVIKYYDANGVLYKSNLGSNTSHDLVITSSQHFTENGIQYVIIKGYFSGNVYKSSDPTQYKNLYATYFKLKYVEFVE